LRFLTNYVSKTSFVSVIRFWRETFLLYRLGDDLFFTGPISLHYFWFHLASWAFFQTTFQELVSFPHDLRGGEGGKFLLPSFGDDLCSIGPIITITGLFWTLSSTFRFFSNYSSLETVFFFSVIRYRENMGLTMSDLRSFAFQWAPSGNYYHWTQKEILNKEYILLTSQFNSVRQSVITKVYNTLLSKWKHITYFMTISA
jgi:hypothetical protein